MNPESGVQWSDTVEGADANCRVQPQQSPSAQGSRVLYQGNATGTVGRIGYNGSGTIDQCILDWKWRS